VRSASKSNAVESGRPAPGQFQYVIEFEEPRLGTAMAMDPNERAPVSIPLSDGAPNMSGNGPRMIRSSLRRLGLRRRRELLPLELGNRQIQDAIENLRELAAWDLMAQEVANMAQLRVSIPANGEVNGETLRSDGSDLRPGNGGLSRTRALLFTSILVRIGAG